MIEPPTDQTLVESEFPACVGEFVDVADGPQPKMISISAAAKRFPSFLSPEDVKAFAEAARIRSRQR